MRKVWLIADSIISPLGLTTAENFKNVKSGLTGVKVKNEKIFGDTEVCVSHCAFIKRQADATRFETMARMALAELSNQVSIPTGRTVFILSTTKGNIELLEAEQPSHSRISLHALATLLSNEINIKNKIVVSNACTSGVTALILAKRQIESGHFDHAVVLGADVLTRFVISGFQSLNALSPKPCQPFDSNRAGINLGEAAAAVLVTANPEAFHSTYKVALLGGAISNDANHISGPSKTGEELASAINQTLKQSETKKEEVDFVSAHGTGTIYNDEMEAKAFDLAGLAGTPIHSLKGNFGHTLGAAGVLESVMCVQSLLNQIIIPSFGFEINGISKPLNVIKEGKSRPLRTALKTSSGFGGCNAAILLQREN